MKSRGDIIGTNDTVQLKCSFYDNGVLADLSSFPTIEILFPDGSTYKPQGSTGVYRISTGTYGYNLTVPLNSQQGVYTDIWIGDLNGESITGSFNFIVLNENIEFTSPNDGYEHLGAEPNLELSQDAIHNINILISILRKRLQSSGRKQTKDSYGNTVYENCDIFSVEELYTFLCSSLSEFNQTPHFTDFYFENPIVLSFRDVLVEGAYIMALYSKSLVERGKQFSVSDNGISFNIPEMGDFLNSQAGSLLSPYREKLKYIKANMKPAPLGLGTIRTAATSTFVSRQRHIRSGRLI